jgi:hypothetical protein
LYLTPEATGNFLRPLQSAQGVVACASPYIRTVFSAALAGRARASMRVPLRGQPACRLNSPFRPGPARSEAATAKFVCRPGRGQPSNPTP